MVYKNSRRVVSFMLVIAMLMTLLVGTTAWFTDRVSTTTNGTAGTVTINVNDTGINLKDQLGKDILNPGDLRKVNYTVTNTGNKSVDIKETIYLSAYDKLGQKLNLSDTQSEFELYKASDVIFFDNRGWIPKENTEPLQVKSLNENIITYDIPTYTLNGSTNFEDINREIEDSIDTDFKTNDFVLIFKALSNNTFQGAVLKLDLIVEAKQHRNTESVLWSEVSNNSYLLSNGNTIDVVPGVGIVVNPSEDFTVIDLGNNNIKITGLTETGANKDTLIIPTTITDNETGKSYNVSEIDWKNIFKDSKNNKINNGATGLPQPEDKLIFDMTTENSKTTITGINENGNKLTNISIPNQIEDKNVEISDNMVEDIKNTDADVTIPDSVVDNLPATSIYTYSKNGDTVTITGLTSIGLKVGKLDIPSEIEGSTVTTIAEYSLFNTKATEVTVPATITTANSAFAAFNIGTGRNRSIKVVTLNNSIISNNMFMGAEALETVNITSNVNYIGDYAFNSCPKLNNIRISEGVTKIGVQSFSDCTSLSDLILPSTITNICDGAFMNCKSLTNIIIPSSVTTVGKLAFANCSSLTDITFENNVIGERMFENCDALTNIIIPSNITRIGYRAFANCDNITDIVIENSIIGREQFYNCNALKEITIPASVKTYDKDYMHKNGAFSTCKNLEIINFEDGAIIGTSMFENCTKLNNIVIPESVTILEGAYGARTFANCTGLINITLNNSAVVSQMFAGCSNLSNVILNDNVKSIGNQAFNGCTSLKSINLNKVEKIDSLAFYKSGIEGEIILPSTVTSIGSKAYQGTKITKITIPASVKKIDSTSEKLFNGCKNLTDIYISSTTTIIGDKVFSGLDNVTIHYAGDTSGFPWGATNSRIVTE